MSCHKKHWLLCILSPALVDLSDCNYCTERLCISTMLTILLLFEICNIFINFFKWIVKNKFTYYPKAIHSKRTSWPATGASGNALGKLLGNFSCWKFAKIKRDKIRYYWLSISIILLSLKDNGLQFLRLVSDSNIELRKLFLASCSWVIKILKFVTHLQHNFYRADAFRAWVAPMMSRPIKMHLPDKDYVASE